MGTFFIVSTPIGNLEDITVRAIKILLSVPTIACEDTRRTGLLLSHLHTHYSSLCPQATSPNLVRFDERTESKTIPKIINLLQRGDDVALVGDAGTPLVSDPGFLLVREALRRNIRVISIPGASAALASLTSSGLPTHTFFFLGYPPEKKSHRIALFRHVSQIDRLMKSTYIMYCAPHKLLLTLEDMENVFGDRDIVIARELTKIHEEVWRGKLSQARENFQSAKGEFVILWY